MSNFDYIKKADIDELAYIISSLIIITMEEYIGNCYLDQEYVDEQEDTIYEWLEEEAITEDKYYLN